MDEFLTDLDIVEERSLSERTNSLVAKLRENIKQWSSAAQGAVSMTGGVEPERERIRRDQLAASIREDLPATASQEDIEAAVARLNAELAKLGEHKHGGVKLAMVGEVVSVEVAPAA